MSFLPCRPLWLLGHKTCSSPFIIWELHGKAQGENRHSFLHCWTQMLGLSDNNNICTSLFIIRVSSKVFWAGPSQTWRFVVWSWYCQSWVKLHVWVSLPLVSLDCHERKKTRKDGGGVIDGEIEMGEWEKRQVMGESSEEEGMESSLEDSWSLVNL